MQKSLTVSQIANQQILVINQKFTYEYFEENRYLISEGKDYEALCNNGFIKLYTQKGRVYWHAQNEFSHETLDWKFHISVKPEYIKKAWNIIAALFMKMECRSGMKVNYMKQNENPAKGREITIYLIKYCPQFKNSSFAGQFGLSLAIEHSEDFWFQMCQKIQDFLDSQGIEPNGLANGDLKLGKYISLRNQSFTRNGSGQSRYPSDDLGWNAANQPIPIDLNRFKSLSETQKAKDEQEASPKTVWLFYGSLAITLGLFYFIQYSKYKSA